MRPGFGATRSSPLDAILKRAHAAYPTLITQVRLWWEARWKQPSRGNPLWTDVPFAEHLQSLFENELASGRDPLIVDGLIYLTEDADRGIVWEEKDGKRRLVKLRESDEEWIARMVDEEFPVDD